MKRKELAKTFQIKRKLCSPWAIQKYFVVVKQHWLNACMGILADVVTWSYCSPSWCLQTNQKTQVSDHNTGVMLTHRLRRWPIIKPVSGDRLIFARRPLSEEDGWLCEGLANWLADCLSVYCLAALFEDASKLQVSCERTQLYEHPQTTCLFVCFFSPSTLWFLLSWLHAFYSLM